MSADKPKTPKYSYTPVDNTGANKANPDPGVAKFWIMSLDENSLHVAAQFNPKELQIDRAVPWSPPGEAGKSNSKTPGGVDLEFTGAKGRSLTVELLFDQYEEDAQGQFTTSVKDNVNTLETLASVRKPGSKEEKFRRPHHCVCSWGTALRSTEGNKFKCVIESIATKYTMFDSNGDPLRATVTLKLTEADNVSVKKEEKGAK
ncbi:MAG TPA: hypothetical protein VL326_22805 [Kofleriaceae bacterium]|jgi:hypothetical protein|nr:hypothetical protein [Kofleriaceae bacterium]